MLQTLYRSKLLINESSAATPGWQSYKINEVSRHITILELLDDAITFNRIELLLYYDPNWGNAVSRSLRLTFNFSFIGLNPSLVEKVKSKLFLLNSLLQLLLREKSSVVWCKGRLKSIVWLECIQACHQA